MTEIQQLTFDRDSLTEQHIRDAQNAEDWPKDDLQRVTIQPKEITIEGTPTGLRWLYDYLNYLKRAWRSDGEQFDADAAEEMAEQVWNETNGELPDRKRPRKQLL